MIVVANSSVLIALCRIGMLNLLHQKFPEGIFIPEAVWHEVVKSGRGQPGSEEVSSSPWIKVKKVKDEKLDALQKEGNFRIAPDVYNKALRAVSED